MQIYNLTRCLLHYCENEVYKQLQLHKQYKPLAESLKIITHHENYTQKEYISLAFKT